MWAFFSYKGKGHQIFIVGVLYYDKGENYELFVQSLDCSHILTPANCAVKGFLQSFFIFLKIFSKKFTKPHFFIWNLFGFCKFLTAEIFQLFFRILPCFCCVQP